MGKTRKRVLVTGGAGFIGSHLVDALLADGCEVAVVDNLSTGKRANLAHVKDRIAFKKGDIRDLDTMKEMAQGCSAIFHQAAVVSVPQTVDDPLGSSAVNDMGTLVVLEAARLQGVKRVVLASSCAVYGDDPEIPKHEKMVLKPQSPYAVQKLTNELHARLYSDLYGLHTVCLRYFNVFGPRQDPSSAYSGVISIFMTRAVENRRTGHTWRWSPVSGFCLCQGCGAGQFAGGGHGRCKWRGFQYRNRSIRAHQPALGNHFGTGRC